MWLLRVWKKSCGEVEGHWQSKGMKNRVLEGVDLFERENWGRGSKEEEGNVAEAPSSSRSCTKRLLRIKHMHTEIQSGPMTTSPSAHVRFKEDAGTHCTQGYYSRNGLAQTSTSSNCKKTSSNLSSFQLH